MRPVLLICPDPDSFVSGGNVYNRRLMDVLRAAGRQVGWMPFETLRQQKPMGPALNLVDSIYLEEFRRDPPRLSGPAGLLCHYLPGLEEAAPHESAVANRWRWLLPAFDFLIVPSAFLRDLLLKHTGWPADRLVVLPPIARRSFGAYPMLQRPESEGRSHPKQDLPLLLIVANLVPVKGVAPFLKAFDQVLASIPRELPFQLAIYGSQNLDPEYADQCRRLILENPRLRNKTLLHSGVPQEMLYQVYQEAALLISASRFESYGMAVDEAIAAGLPVLALEAGNLPYLIREGHTGSLYAGVNELAAGVVEWLLKPEALLTWKRQLAREKATARVEKERDWAIEVFDKLDQIILK